MCLKTRSMMTRSLTLTSLPSENVAEILSWLPGEDIGRCKCVCKPWLLMIESTLFSSVYRKNQRYLMMDYYTSQEEGVEPPDNTSGLLFYSSPLSRHHPEEFRLLFHIPTVTMTDEVTQLVNGIVCVVELEKGHMVYPNVAEMMVYNVCTRESMVIPKPKSYVNAESRFHLGYEPESGTYKLLRLVFFFVDSKQTKVKGLPLVEIITLRPMTSDLIWRDLKFIADGKISFSGMDRSHVFEGIRRNEVRTFPGDRALWWVISSEGEGLLVSFDLNLERFRIVKLPPQLRNFKDSKLQIVPRSGPLRSLWINHRDEWYEMEDSDGEKWSKHCVQFPEIFRDNASGDLGLNWCNSFHSDGVNIMLINEHHSSDSMALYSYGNRDNIHAERFLVGNLPDDRNLNSNVFTMGLWFTFNARVSCLMDNNNLYLPLKRIFSS